MLGLWYKSVNFGEENGAPELKWDLEEVSVDRDVEGHALFQRWG